MAVMIARAMEIEAESQASFQDQSDIPVWAQDATNIAVEQNIITGYEDGSFRPGKNATRADAAKMIYKLLVAVYI